MDENQLRRVVIDELWSLWQSGVRQLPRVTTEARLPIAEETAAPRPDDVAARDAAGGATAQTPAPASAPSPYGRKPPPTEAPSAVVRADMPLLTPQETSCSMTLAERLSELNALRLEVEACQRCPALVANRTRTVFGVGNPESRLCFLGEAPGADEDRLGEPFVGRAGELLNRMIAACTLRREDIYILNILKCRPPNNRQPEADEVENCRPFFERQLELLRPEFICCLGAVAAQNLLQVTTPVGKLRGTVHRWRWAKVVVTYHPAYLLRSPNQKRYAWEDLKLLMREMGVELS